jgi:hypothetical protein
MTRALAAVQYCASQGDTFTTDDVWLVLARWNQPRPHEKRAMGAVMRQAVQRKIARPLNAVQGSTSTVNHGRPLRVWRRC